MRIAIREQLAALVLAAVLLALAILSIPIWVYVNQFVLGVTNRELTLAASLKSAQVASEIELIQTTVTTIATRLLVQQALKSFYRDSNSAHEFNLAANDLRSALNSQFGGSNLFQARLYSRNETGSSTRGLLNVTGSDVPLITLPYPAPNGSEIQLGDSEFGFPPALYPNLTYVPSEDPDPYNPGHRWVIARPFPDIRLDTPSNGLILGPLIINGSYSLLSITTPIRDNDGGDVILGYITVIASASSIIRVCSSVEGVGNTGSVLLIGPATGWNRFSKYNLPANTTHAAVSNFSNVDVQFVFPPRPQPGNRDRHSLHNYASGDYLDPFKSTDYDAVYRAFTQRNLRANNASSMLSTTNEQGIKVAVGYARPPTVLVNWTLIVEQDQAEAHAPIETLRAIILGCVFGTVGLVLVIVFPCAHLSVKPIRRLKAATEKSIAPPGYADAFSDEVDKDNTNLFTSTSSSEKGFSRYWKRLTGNVSSTCDSPEPKIETKRHAVKIPGKVDDRKHFITDELTELTKTFNYMSDELYQQYASMEDKVAERTHELEISKKAAEAANESKTLFIANISHELKTPLNGIMGMASICMEEDDVLKIRNSLKTLYKSGDLLLHLLEDLLSFSKNQIGQQLSLEEREFRLGDIKPQILTIFDKQVREGSIDFSVSFLNTDLSTDPSATGKDLSEKLPAIGPLGAGRLKDMCIWGDQHRILQVIINLVSNSLKFTPTGGKVSVRVRCLCEIPQQQQQHSDDSRTSSMSKTGSGRRGRARNRLASASSHSTGSRAQVSIREDSKSGTSLAINPAEPKVMPQVQVRERSLTPPPPSAKAYLFEFEVEDTGPGIPEHMRDMVFEPFTQGDLGLSKKYGGTGLGLSICQQLATLMGGTISLSSTVGVGTTFTMRIPLKYTNDRSSSTASSSIRSRAQSVVSAENDSRRNSLLPPGPGIAEEKGDMLEQQPRLVGLSQPFFTANPQSPSSASADDQMKVVQQAAATKSEGKLRVLVAEDNNTNIEVVTRMLKLEDVLDVTIARDGQEAYELVKHAVENNMKFDLILMDIQMPNLDGLQSTRLIRSMGYKAPIVALTAFSEASNMKECKDVGMDEFLSKPIRRPALKQVLKRFATISEEPEPPEPIPVLKKSLSDPPPTMHTHPINGVSPVEHQGSEDNQDAKRSTTVTVTPTT